MRESSDPLTYAYLKALGRRLGEEVAVNTSFNVAGPIAQTPLQAIETLRRSKGMDVVLDVRGGWRRVRGMAPQSRSRPPCKNRFRGWLREWRAECAAANPRQDLDVGAHAAD